MFEKEAGTKGKEFDWKFNLGVDLSDAGARLWKDGVEYRYNKANEVHYPSEGDLPPVSGESPRDRFPVLAYTEELGWTVALRFKIGRKYEWRCLTYDGTILFLDKEIIAWKNRPAVPCKPDDVK